MNIPLTRWFRLYVVGRCNFRLCRFTVFMSGPRTQCFFSVSKVHESIMMWVNSLNIAYNYKINTISHQKNYFHHRAQAV